MKKLLAAVALGTSVLAAPALAHFQLAYTPQVNLEQGGGELPFGLIFWHPMENGHVMDMAEPEQFFQIFKGERTDLKESLKPITFQGAENAAKAYKADIKVRRMGDYIFVVVPAPYYEKNEDLYIQQITKSYVNVGDMPTGWDAPAGLPTEIVPLNKPTNIMAGSTFTGVLLAEGKPVPDAEIEIEFMSAEPDLAADKAGPVTATPQPGGALVARTDANGVFTFGIPRAGFWGFAALGSGPSKTHDGKELSQDAVIWIRAFDFD